MSDRIKPGDYILCNDVPEDMRGAVEAAFVAAAGGERGEIDKHLWGDTGDDWVLGLCPDGIDNGIDIGAPCFGSTGVTYEHGRRLAMGQVMGFEPMPDDQAADPINHPTHYTQGGIECIDAIEAALGARGALDYCRGCAIKYHWRMLDKGGAEDARKAAWYSRKAAELFEKMEGEE